MGELHDAEDTGYTLQTDIVTRLRGFVSVPQIGRPDMLVQGIEVCTEASDEIERLRAELRDADDDFHALKAMFDKMRAEVRGE